MRTILYVDDDPQITHVFERVLAAKGYKVLVTNHPKEVPQLLADNEIDLVVLDVEMPEVSGLEVFDQLKTKYSSLPVLFATGHREAFSMDSQDKIERWTDGFADGLTDILYKPFEFSELQEKIEAMFPGDGEDET